MEALGEIQIREFLAAHGLKRRIRTFAESTRNAALAAQALGVDRGQIVKSLLFLADDQPVLILMSGDMNVHTKKLKQHLRVRKLKIADAETVFKVTGYPVGGVPPVAHRQPIPTALDVSLQRFSKIYPAAGSSNSMFCSTFAELLQLAGAEIIDVAAPRKET
ncbi:MAG: YbaK/EbsC family protein [Syntrophobacteria bacterium]